MRRLLYLLFCACALAQTQPSPPVQKPLIGPQPLQDSYPFPLERRDQIRDLQYKFDQDEIQIQKLQVEIEKIKQEKIQIINDISTLATDFAKIKQVDPDVYELDPLGVRLVKKKPMILPMPGAVQTNVPAQGTGRKP